MKNKHYKISLKGIFAVLLSLVLFISCEKDFLEDNLHSDTSVNFLYYTAEGLESAVVGLHSLHRNIYQQQSQNGTYPLILKAKSDLGVGITGEVSLYCRLLWGASLGDYGTTSGINAHWVHFYRLVDRTNAIIKSAENLADIDQSRRDQILAEAKAMRAHAFFSLYRLFNNIFITTEPTTPENAFDVPQDKSSAEEIFALLRSDLDFAIAHLDYAPEQFGRWGQGAARHLRAKVAMWENDWSEAAAQADAVINSGYHTLVTTDQVFAGSLEHSESLFTINFMKETIGGGSPHIMSWNMVAGYSDAPGMIQSIENGGAGAGFISLNQYVIDLLNEDPDDNRKNNTYYIFNYAYNDPAALPPGKELGDPLDLYENHPTDQNEFMLYYRRQNPGVLKFFDENVEPTDRNHFKNIMIYRLAETYLIGAEAHMMMSNTTKALEYLNKIRERANTDPVSTIDLQTVLDERARELAFEGQR